MWMNSDCGFKVPPESKREIQDQEGSWFTVDRQRFMSIMVLRLLITGSEIYFAFVPQGSEIESGQSTIVMEPGRIVGGDCTCGCPVSAGNQ